MCAAPGHFGKMGGWERLLGFSLEILTATKSPQPWGSALTASLHRHHKVLLAGGVDFQGIWQHPHQKAKQPVRLSTVTAAGSAWGEE